MADPTFATCAKQKTALAEQFITGATADMSHVAHIMTQLSPFDLIWFGLAVSIIGRVRVIPRKSVKHSS